MRYTDVQRTQKTQKTQKTRVRAEQVILGDPREVAEWEDAQDPGDLREFRELLMQLRPWRLASEGNNSW